MKQFISLLFAALLLFVSSGCGPGGPPENSGERTPPPNSGKRVLNFLSWADNFDPQVLSGFEKQNNCIINYDVFFSHEELLARVQADGARYDLIQPSDYMVAVMIKHGILEKLDLKNIPNVQNMVSYFQNPPFDPKEEYSVIYSWGVTGIAYNKKYVKTPPVSWADLWKSEYKGRVILFNDSREVIGMALKKNGFSNSSSNPAEIAVAFNDLKKLAPNVLAYDTDNIKQKFIAEEGWIGVMWSGDAVFAQADNKNIDYVIPKENGTIWADTFAIPQNAPNRELAERFINYLYDAKVSIVNYENIGYITPDKNAYGQHSASYRNNPIFQASIKAIPDSEWLTDTGGASALYDKYWQELRAIKEDNDNN